MSKSTSYNLAFELESVKNETEAEIFDDGAGESATPGIDQTMQGVKEKRQASAELEYAWQSDMVVLRRMLFVVVAVAAVALLVAIATLILALTAMKPRNDSTAKVQGKQNSVYFKREKEETMLT